MDLITELEKLRLEHFCCVDPFYSCPQAIGGCWNPDAGTECDCGADEHNRQLEQVILFVKETWDSNIFRAARGLAEARGWQRGFQSGKEHERKFGTGQLTPEEIERIQGEWYREELRGLPQIEVNNTEAFIQAFVIGDENADT
ncbi:MAG: hypothetical protein GF334_03160 [Candidatus Altiarchaeales archaeon]|nr:hypothetical protein [Candidatus Altiarchaeales archaeon]